VDVGWEEAICECLETRKTLEQLICNVKLDPSPFHLTSVMQGINLCFATSKGSSEKMGEVWG